MEDDVSTIVLRENAAPSDKQWLLRSSFFSHAKQSRPHDEDRRSRHKPTTVTVQRNTRVPRSEVCRKDYFGIFCFAGIQKFGVETVESKVRHDVKLQTLCLPPIVMLLELRSLYGAGFGLPVPNDDA